MPYHSDVPVVGGVRVSREPVLELAAMLMRDGSDRTARLLLEAITTGREFVALTTDDRESILAVLDHPPHDELVELRGALFSELNWQRTMGRGPRHWSRSPYARLVRADGVSKDSTSVG